MPNVMKEGDQLSIKAELGELADQAGDNFEEQKCNYCGSRRFAVMIEQENRIVHIRVNCAKCGRKLFNLDAGDWMLD